VNVELGREVLQMNLDEGSHDIARRTAVRLPQLTQRLPLRPPEHQRPVLLRILFRHTLSPDMPEKRPRMPQNRFSWGE